jgi:hypothetical protein
MSRRESIKINRLKLIKMSRLAFFPINDLHLLF